MVVVVVVSGNVDVVVISEVVVTVAAAGVAIWLWAVDVVVRSEVVGISIDAESVFSSPQLAKRMLVTASTAATMIVIANGFFKISFIFSFVLVAGYLLGTEE